MTTKRIPDATVDRLPLYLRVLESLTVEGETTVSSERLAELTGVNAAKLRKDLSYIGSYGTRGVGYEVDYLRFEITAKLGLATPAGIAIVGMGNLGRALANHKGFGDRGFPVAALFDIDEAKVGTTVGGHEIRHLDQIGDAEAAITIAAITTPAPSAQAVVDRLVAAGVRAILNFAPVVLAVPADVTLRNVDLTLELQVLSYYQQRATP